MTKEQAMHAAMERSPVICNGVRYRRISAIIFRYLGDTDKLSMAHDVPNEAMFLELEDWKANSRSVVNLRAVELDRG